MGKMSVHLYERSSNTIFKVFVYSERPQINCAKDLIIRPFNKKKVSIWLSWFFKLRRTGNIPAMKNEGQCQ